MAEARKPTDAVDERRQALETLDRLREHPTYAGSSLAAAAGRAARHFAGKNAGEKDAVDPVELWGRRLGRALSLAGCVGLAIYLYVTYLR